MLRERQSTCDSIARTINEILPLYSLVVKAGTPEQAFILTRMFQEKIALIQLEITKQDETPFSLKINAEYAPEISALLKKDCSIVSLKIDDNSLMKGHTVEDDSTGPTE
ncbi:hypothetical protein DPMN_135499 [Dreissena polymorpha]|uniref:Uncharacterized protein n=1 Tax=Dreissena polymorpha TaxID=45954 RepID=A0A9D4FZA1_DREPO|nr:hypothetical protein DPMN_135499 [Dreissena polymorpha]